MLRRSSGVRIAWNSIREYSQNVRGPPKCDLPGAEELRTWRTPWEDGRSKTISLSKLLRGDKPELSGKLPLKIATFDLEQYRRTKEIVDEKQEQLPNMEYSDNLGGTLSAGHFFVKYGGRVRFSNNPDWIVFDKIRKQVPLPKIYTPGYFLTHVDCEGFKGGGLIYEGLDYFIFLDDLVWLSLKGNTSINDWSIDRLTCITRKSLEYLNLNNCSITHRCFSALCRLEKLKVLELNSFQITKELEVACSMLESEKSDLLIKFVD